MWVRQLCWYGVRRQVPRVLYLAPAVAVPVQPTHASSVRTFTTTHATWKKKSKGGGAEKAADPVNVEPQLDLDAVATNMLNAVKRCSESVRSMVGSLGRVDATLLDDVRVSTGKGVKPSSLQDYATVGVRDNALVIHAYEPGILKHIEKAIYAVGKDLSPQIVAEEEDVMIVHVPKPTGETRKALLQKCIKECDQGKGAVRSARQSAQKHLKHDTDAKILSKNESQKEAKRLEDISKKHTAMIDQIASDAQKRLTH